MLEGRSLTTSDLADIARLGAAEWLFGTYVGVVLIALASAFTAVTLGALLRRTLAGPPAVAASGAVLMVVCIGAALTRAIVVSARGLQSFKMTVIGRPRPSERLVWSDRTVLLLVLGLCISGVIEEWRGAIDPEPLFYVAGPLSSATGRQTFILSIVMQAWSRRGAWRADAYRERSLRRWQPAAKSGSHPAGQAS